MMWLCYIIMIVVPYLLGGVNTSIIVTKLKTGKDIRTMGSGNAGLTNTLRTQGKAVAGIVLLGDVAKAVLAIWAVRLAFQFIGGVDTTVLENDMNWVGYMAGFMAVVGHVFPVYYGFRGGKGVLAAISAIFTLDWRTGCLLLAVFIIIVAVTRYVSLGSCIASSLYGFGTLGDAEYDLNLNCLLHGRRPRRYRLHIHRILHRRARYLHAPRKYKAPCRSH